MSVQSKHERHQVNQGARCQCECDPQDCTQCTKTRKMMDARPAQVEELDDDEAGEQHDLERLRLKAEEAQAAIDTGRSRWIYSGDD